ncbi:MAG: gamma-glutamylcyclotransferase [Oscillibacter sp.]|nr:gamma-glutamylcyclotransferase [Oscillibacter sp.]
MEKRRYYLAYGSNLNIRQMRSRCPEARIIGTAEIPDYQLLFKGSGTGAYLTIERKKGAAVPVGVWSVTAADEASLDMYEGFPSFYYKTEMTVTVKGIQSGKNSRRKALVYIMHEDRKPGIPNRRYVNTCAEGYRDFGFDERILAEAINKSISGSGE